VAIANSQIIDACVLINLLATEEIDGILNATLRTSVICSTVEKETIYLRTDDPQNPQELIQTSPFVQNGLLTICELEGPEEKALYVDYASVLDDGEAMTLAIAVSRGWVLVTDEKKARRIFLEDVGDRARLVGTSELLREWSESQRISPHVITRVLTSIERRARYRPPPTDLNFDWWITSITE
jgi:predicted nucleic acid-binding protein